MGGADKLKVAISCGDGNGIGLEVVLKTFADERMLELCIPIIYANQSLVNAHLACLNLEMPKLHFLKDASKAKPSGINVVEAFEEEYEITIGKPSKAGGIMAYLSLKAAVEDLASNKTDVLVTAPIDKSNIQSDEFAFPGHTEFLADYANEEHPLMVLMHEQLRVALVTGHIPLNEVSSRLNAEGILSKLRVLNKSLTSDFGIPRPKIAVLGLNPHASDHGLLGTEEQEIIAPALRDAVEEGILAFGPFAADGFFGSTDRSRFDAVLAMYHDQGLAPFKALAFNHGVNFTAGLPIVRTSPDHGTAFGIAGKDCAEPNSFRQAVFAAIDIRAQRKQHQQLVSGALNVSSEKA